MRMELISPRVYLRHFLLLHGHLIPRYFFLAALSATIVAGWASVLYLSGVLDPTTTAISRQTVLYILAYGFLSNSLVAGILRQETASAPRNEKI
jgi:sugar phosphate permease